MGRAVKQALIATVLSGGLAALTGCISVAPKPEPMVTTTKHKAKLVRTTSTPKIDQQKKVTAKKVIKPVEEAPVVVPALGGGGGGGGGWG
ncbi:hypothetical protein [Mesorhizobium erdmanii]|uniref:hypothetical protein n=1 Tax=Mesorhizobium erdmanii TaxID=1777866 RepID=UPI000425A290|nr:hypothetical protein [Mesorhizobium erdmanii]